MNQNNNIPDTKADINSPSAVTGNRPGDRGAGASPNHKACESEPAALPSNQPGQVRQSTGAPRQSGELWSQPTPFLTQAEEVLLLRAIELGTQAGFTEAEAITVWEWARKARINQCLLDLTLDGHLAIKFRDGEIVFITVPASTAEEPPNASIAAMSKKFL